MKWMRGYAAGLLTALLVCGLAVTAGARTGKVMQELDYRDIRVSLDGEILDLRNAIGEKVEPFMFGGTNYLPVRALAEALGLNVAWDGKEVMVVLTTPEPEVITVTPTTEPNAEPLKDPAPEAEAAPEVTPVTNPEPVEETVTMPAPEPEPVQVAEPSNKAEVGDCNVEIKTARLLRNYDDALAIVVAFQWTNGKNYTISAAGPLTIRATQNGEELQDTYPDGYDSAPYFTRVEPGGTLEFEQAFALKDDKSPVEITVSSTTDTATNTAVMTFHPSDLKKPDSVKQTTPAPAVKSGPTVYITNTGKHYHYSSTCNGGHYFPVTLSEAVGLGLTPCDKCA